MKLIIQIPCLNEEETLPRALAGLPREVDGFDRVEWLVIDDGSTDRTVEMALAHGADHVVSLPHNRGLAKAFMAGIEASLKLGADVIVNTDADDQYDAADIPALVAPILSRRAQIVIGERPIREIAQFSPVKKWLQGLGSRVVRMVSGTDVKDAPSGFRAFHRDAALRLYVFNGFTYTLETIIQAGLKNIPVATVPVRVNPATRPSRLFKSNLEYVLRSVLTILRIFIVYKPLRFFALVAALAALPGLLGIGRFLLHYVLDGGQGQVQSLILSGALVAIAAVILVGGLVADVIAANRILLEEIRARQLRGEIESATASVDGGAAPRVPFRLVG